MDVGGSMENEPNIHTVDSSLELLAKLLKERREEIAQKSKQGKTNPDEISLFDDKLIYQLLKDIAQNGNMLSVATIKRYVTNKLKANKEMQLRIPQELYSRVFENGYFAYYYTVLHEKELANEEIDALQNLMLNWADENIVGNFASIERVDTNKFFEIIKKSTDRVRIGEFMCRAYNKLTDEQFDELQQKVLDGGEFLDTKDRYGIYILNDLAYLARTNNKLLENSMAKNLLNLLKYPAGSESLETWVKILDSNGSDLSIICQAVIGAKLYDKFPILLYYGDEKIIKNLDEAILECDNFNLILNYYNKHPNTLTYNWNGNDFILARLLEIGSVKQIVDLVLDPDRIYDLKIYLDAIVQKATKADGEAIGKLLTRHLLRTNEQYLTLFDTIITCTNGRTILEYAKMLVNYAPSILTKERVRAIKKVLYKENVNLLTDLFVKPTITGKFPNDNHAFELTDNMVSTLISVNFLSAEEIIDLIKNIASNKQHFLDKLLDKLIQTSTLFHQESEYEKFIKSVPENVAKMFEQKIISGGSVDYLSRLIRVDGVDKQAIQNRFIEVLTITTDGRNFIQCGEFATNLPLSRFVINYPKADKAKIVELAIKTKHVRVMLELARDIHEKDLLLKLKKAIYDCYDPNDYLATWHENPIDEINKLTASTDQNKVYDTMQQIRQAFGIKANSGASKKSAEDGSDDVFGA